MPAPTRIPDREEVYQSWLYVRQLEIKLELAKAAHEELFKMRYVTGGVPREEPGAPPDLCNST